MMRAGFSLLFIVLLFACADSEKAKPLSERGEKLYTMRGVIVSRDVEANSLSLDHEAIPGFMEAMRMDYSVRGAKVTSLPPDKTRVEAQLHVTDRAYWVTNVKAVR